MIFLPLPFTVCASGRAVSILPFLWPPVVCGASLSEDTRAARMGYGEEGKGRCDLRLLRVTQS